MEDIIKRKNSGKLYDPSNEKLAKVQFPAMNKLQEYNNLPYNDIRCEKMLKEMFADIGENCMITQPFFSNWGGKNVHFGNNVYANFNLTLVDDGDIYVEDNVMLGPNVTLVTATHPICPTLRKSQMQYNLPVRICQNAWLGANVIILPGITVGKNAIVGAGSVVTKDVPANTVAAGNPCRVLREITARDDIYYNRDKIIDIPIE